MIKRPLCTAAVLYLCIQAILTAGFHIAPDLRPGSLEIALEQASDEKKGPAAGKESGQKAGKSSQVTLAGTVYRREEKPDYKVLYLKDNQVLLNNRIYQESKILVYVETENQVKVKNQVKIKNNIASENTDVIKIGNKIKISGEAKTFQGARNPGNFDQKFYYQKQGIHASVWADQVEIKEDRVYHLRENLAVLRAGWKEMLISSLGTYYGNSMSAILLGEKSELDSELKDLYQKSGIGHILAISGLHMSFLGIGLYQILRKIGLSFGAAGGMGICFLLAYTLMIGCGVSSIRAFVMFFVRMGADITGRDYDVPTSLALAAGVLAAWQPLYLMDAGFLLSFGALLGIVGVNPCLQYWFLQGGKREVEQVGRTEEKRGHKKGLKRKNKQDKVQSEKRKAWMESICASLAVNLTLLPIMLYFYFEFPLYSILLNLLVIPLMSLLLGAGAAGSLFMIFIPGLGGMVLKVCKWILVLYEKACQMSMSLPMSRIVTGQPGKGWIICYYLVLVGFCAISLRMREREEIAEEKGMMLKAGLKRVLGSCTMSSLCLFLGISCFLRYQCPGKLTITMLDVGQGDGFYLRGPNGTNYFIDGGSSDVSSVGKYRIEPYLKSQGVRSLNYVFISHGDADHMNGIEEMLENQQFGIRIHNLVLPPVTVQDDTLKGLAKKAVQCGTKVLVMGEGDKLGEEEFHMMCKGPFAAYQGEPGNAASMVLEVSFHKFQMLFTGDVEGEGESLLVKSGELKLYDVLKVAHHGSKNSNSEEFLSQTVPKCAWISSGIGNRYGHPHEETIQKLNEIGSEIYGTQERGAVTLVTDGEEAEIKSYMDKKYK